MSQARKPRQYRRHRPSRWKTVAADAKRVEVPVSLASELAEQRGITLAGYARRDGAQRDSPQETCDVQPNAHLDAC